MFYLDLECSQLDTITHDAISLPLDWRLQMSRRLDGLVAYPPLDCASPLCLLSKARRLPLWRLDEPTATAILAGGVMPD
jgi:hypothetical protein